MLLEEELGYDRVELKLLGVRDAFLGVGAGELDGFQDVWMPNHEGYLEEVEGRVELLDPWFQGETAYGIAVPEYMGVKRLPDLEDSGTDMIVGIEPGVPFHEQISSEVIPGYGLDVKLVESSTPAMLAELDKAYKEREPFVFLGWSPHWMNTRYDFRYLEDPDDLQGAFNDPSRITSVVREGLEDDDPTAHAFLKGISLTEAQINALEAEILESGDPRKGARRWIRDNPRVVEPWLEAAERTGED